MLVMLHKPECNDDCRNRCVDSEYRLQLNKFSDELGKVLRDASFACASIHYRNINKPF